MRKLLRMAIQDGCTVSTLVGSYTILVKLNFKTIITFQLLVST